ncbi:hypothetical protein VHUM_02171 [Vanrija humicola]|uniref:Transcriptional regulator n=1 Tax=Vanrija humicola TaxID=5417 RepID=A0A7D8V1T4_VANHU|nr:hypothetical protein VHUM_02171 [Vanrija humicola]
MYIRATHAELDVPTLVQFVKDYPLGLFTTSIKSEIAATIQTSHIPFVIDEADGDRPARLRAHIARANPQAKVLIEAAKAQSNGTATLPDEVLVLFNAPVNAYVTAKFYTETKPDTGKVVPTWNYAAVQVYGKIKVYGESNDESSAFLQGQIEELSERQERAAGHEKPWKVSDAPDRYIDIMKKAILGFEITIDRIEGRFKLSQESPDGDWAGVVKGFRALGTERSVAMADMIESRGKNRNVSLE